MEQLMSIPIFSLILHSQFLNHPKIVKIFVLGRFYINLIWFEGFHPELQGNLELLGNVPLSVLFHE